MLWHGRIRFQLPPQFGDVGVDGSSQHRRRVPPDLLQQLEAAGDAASPIQQRDQQIEFHGCEGHGDTVAMHAARGGIDFDRTEGLARNVGGRTAASGPSQQRADTRHQLEQAKWFGDVVVCAEPESSHLVEMTQHQAMLEGIRRALKPTGRLVILEPISPSRRTSPRRDQTAQHEIASELVLQDARDAGFTLSNLEEPFSRHSGHGVEWLMVLTP